MTHLPRPSIWPVTLALGASLAALGALVSPFVVIAGALLVMWGLLSWILLLLDEEEHP